MAIEELKGASGQASTSTAQLKESIWTVNSLLTAELKPPSSQDIAKHPIFPVRHPNGSVRHVSAETEFFVVDRLQLRQAFESKAELLDFLLEDLVRLRPFLNWMDLEDRYLSNRVKEITSFHGEGASLSRNENRQVWNRAHALLRCVFVLSAIP